MKVVAPNGIKSLWSDIDKLIPAAKLGGIEGDHAHYATGGYHVPRRHCPHDDYSVLLPADRQGDPDNASALDVTLPPHLMKLLTKRLKAAAVSKNANVVEAMMAVREFCGTLDGRRTYPWQLRPSNRSEGINSWDDSHLWHIHLSILRKYSNDYATLAPIAKVLAGKNVGILVKVKTAPAKVNSLKAWPLAPGHSFGLLSSKNPKLHGGGRSKDQPYVAYIQTWLVNHNYVPGVAPGHGAKSGWVDKKFEKATVDAVNRMRKRNNWPQNGVITRQVYLAMINGKAK